MLPNLVIIGAYKAGTTSLHAYLGLHPEIFMAVPDDPLQLGTMKLFWQPDWHERLDWYESHFNVPHRVRGEATAAYTAYPVLPDVPRRMASVIPDAQLIYIVRDPIERIRSHYMQVRSDGDRRSFAEHLKDVEQPENLLVCSSRYATQLRQYLTFFSIEQILVIDQNDLRCHRRDVMRRVFSFVGVDMDFYPDAYDREHNTRVGKKELTPIGAVAWHWMLRPTLKRLPASWARRMRDPVKRMLSRPVSAAPPITGDLRRRLEDHLRPEVEALRDLTNQPFSSWSL